MLEKCKQLVTHFLIMLVGRYIAYSKMLIMLEMLFMSCEAVLKSIIEN
jgi:hypothetical protein